MKEKILQQLSLIHIYNRILIQTLLFQCFKDLSESTVYTGNRGKVVLQHPVAERLRHVVRLDHHVAQTRTVGDEDFELLLFPGNSCCLHCKKLQIFARKSETR